MHKKNYEQLQRSASVDPLSYWEAAAESLHWQKKWDTVLEWDLPRAKWFSGGKLNVSENCLDRHLEHHASRIAITWEGEDGAVRTLSYAELHEKVCAYAELLRTRGIRAGDRIAIYMPLVPEIAVAMLACARIGAIHTVVFAGFSAESLRDRINDCGCKAVITADGGYRKGTIVPLKSTVDQALENNTCKSIKFVLVLKHTGKTVPMSKERDVYVHDALESLSEIPRTCEAFDSDHPLFVLYTSGTTGKPKGIVHGSGGYLTGVVRSTELVFGLKSEDLYWCTADAGWITGHSYMVYGPLACGASIFMYEGAPTYPEPDRFWKMIARHGVSVLYTAPTAIRSFMRCGDEWPARHDLSSLRLLGTVGEPINPAAWHWYNDVIGGGTCPIVDTWWQTETGSIVLSPVPGAVETKPGSATKPLPGLDIEIVSKTGANCETHEAGMLVLKSPWPSMTQGIWGDDQRFLETYWSTVDGMYFSGDEAKKDEDGDFWIFGRMDDVVNVSGHRLGTAEIESALGNHNAVAEAAAVARPDALTGQAIVAFVTLKGEVTISPSLKSELENAVKKQIGSFAKPAEIKIVANLPKTRSGKVMRRLLREFACTGVVTGDITTLEDASVVDNLVGTGL